MEDKFKQTAAILVAMIIAAGLIALMLNITRTDIQNQINSGKASVPQSNTGELSMVEASLDKIPQNYLIMCVETNDNLYSGAKGYLIDSNGNRRDFDLSAEKNDILKDPDKLYKKAIGTDPSVTKEKYLSELEAHNVYTLISGMSGKTEFEAGENSAGNDISTFYVIKEAKGKTDLIHFATSGAKTELPTDPSADAIFALMKDLGSKDDNEIK